MRDITKKVTLLRGTIGCTEEIIVFITYSPKRENLVSSLKEQFKCQEGNIYEADIILKLRSAMDSLVCAARVKRIMDNSGPLLNQMDSFDLFLGLNISHRIYSHL